VNVGPAVTQYGVEPGWDRKFKEIKEKDKDGNISVRLREVSKTRVKVERIASLANDLALALAAPSIKIEAPVPGKAMVGIEVPNSIAGVVSLRGIIESAPFYKLRSKAKLPLALGKGVSGESVVADLAKMPHLLIAGATGSGKSVCIKSAIITFLLHASPDDVRLILIDPKRVELVSFSNVPHLVTPVIVDREKAVATLKWLNREMDHRYDRLAAVGARDIEAYNKNPRVEQALPYLLLVIDELADLMATAPDEVERLLCRLAQLARATGIHLIVATQRPSVDVVTGLIKANFPARISFAVVSQVDSRTILDVGGAEKLLGRGDMLFLPPDAPKPKRLQGSFVSEAEMERLVSFWISQQPQEVYVSQLAQELDQASPGVSHEDPLLEKAKRLALEHRSISTSFLQRRLGIGYPRAARLMDLLEEQGVVAAGEPGKSRQVIGGDDGREVDAK
ncbi:MAG: DNA translocase FtsK, partial [Dehalococcoidia bacterium]|nr:DNA translocase FtsK [Dehalococcoidia bacterium]